MNKLLLLTLFFSFSILIGCSKQDSSTNILENKYYCDVNADCTYSDDSGVNTECVNIKFGNPDIIIYDFPGCVCNNNRCEFEKCENPPCELG